MPLATPVETRAAAPEAPRYSPLLERDGVSLRRCACRARPGDRCEDEQHAAFSVTLVERGVFSYRSGRGEATLGAGWLMLGNEGEGYVCSHDDGDGSGDDTLLLAFPAATLDDLQRALAQNGGPFRRAWLPPLPRVTASFARLVASGGEGFALAETALAVVAEVQAVSGAAPSAPPHQRDRAMAAARHIERHAAEPLSLAEVAGAVGLSPFHFLRSFRRAIGVTPHQYLMRVRLNRALALLRDTSLPVIEVAYEAGWSDLANFTRTFRRDVGCTPREVRRRGTGKPPRRAGSDS